MQNKDKGNSNTNCTFKWHLVYWITIGSNTNRHLTIINLTLLGLEASSIPFWCGVIVMTHDWYRLH
jgi:hypothetical protein